MNSPVAESKLVELRNCIKILAYHSQSNQGDHYTTNDHEAFREDLKVLSRERFKIVTALSLVDHLLSDQLHLLPARTAIITLDDGPIYDARDDLSGLPGERRSMLRIAKEYRPMIFGIPIWRSSVRMTSFVIACEKAREDIADNNSKYLEGSWWVDAQRSGYIDIATHSWNHVHPLVEEVRQSTPHLQEAFHLIDNEQEAERQIVQAARLIRRTTGSPAASLFAYPYGQRGDYLTTHFLPRQNEVKAAFTTDGKPILRDTNRWEIPRYVCNYHWKSPEELAKLLNSD